MNWIKEAENKLKNYPAWKNAIKRTRADIRRLENDFVSIRSANTDGTPVQGGENQREEAMLKNIAERKELENLLQLTERKVAEVNEALAQLHPDEREILEAMVIYFRRGEMYKVEQRLHIDRSTAYRRLKPALEHFTRAFYGAIES